MIGRQVYDLYDGYKFYKCDKEIIIRKINTNELVICPIIKEGFFGYWFYTGKESYISDDYVKKISKRKSLQIKRKSMKIVTLEESEMKQEKLTGYTKVAVIKTDGCISNYHFAIYDDGVDYHPGDKVIVTGNNKIQEISEIITPEEAKDRFDKDIIAEVIGRIDTTAYDKRAEKRKEAKRIKEEMDKKVKEMDELLKYEMYAKQSPEFLSLLNQYKELVR